MGRKPVNVISYARTRAAAEALIRAWFRDIPDEHIAAYSRRVIRMAGGKTLTGSLVDGKIVIVESRTHADK